jgi:type I restriction enzyme S subunit
VPWVKSGDLNDSTVYHTDECITQEGLASSAARILPKGTVLVAMYGATVGKTAILGSSAATNQAVCSIQPNRDQFNARFLQFMLMHYRPTLLKERYGGAQPNISQTIIRALKLPQPSIPEQQKIAAVLWKLQRAIATQDKLLKATADLKASAMQRLFTHGLRGEPLKDTEIGPMPESWQLLPLDQVAKLERGRFMHRPRNEPRFYGGKTPFVQTGDVVRSNGRIRHYSQSLNDDGVAISKVFPEGTILITIAANIGFTGILECDSACPDSLIGITCMEHMDAEFLNFYLQTQQVDMERLAPKGTQKNINLQFLQPWPTKVPALNEQRAIAAALATLDRKLAHHRAKRAALDDLFQTLLHQLMTGAIRVDALDIDVSEVAEPVSSLQGAVA